MSTKRILMPALAGLLIGWSGTAAAQHDELLQFSGQHDLASSALFPSTLGENGQRYFINVASVHAWGGSDFLKLSEAREILDGGQIPSTLVDGVMARLGSRNRAFAGGEVTPLALGYQVRDKNRELFTLSLSWTEQTAGSIAFGEYLPRLAWEGNKGFAGTRLDLGPIEGNAYLRREFALGAAFPIHADENVSMRAGFRAKFAMASAGATFRDVRSEFFTAADGSVISYDLLMQMQLAGSTSVNPMAFNGSGVGIDFGTSVRWADGFSVDVALNDLGSMRYFGDVTTRTFEGETVFEGFEIDDPAQGIDGEDIGSFNDYFQTESTPGGSFRTGMGTHLQARFGYALQAVDRAGRDYDQHAFYLSWVQGFAETATTSVDPIVTGAYVYTLNNLLELGATVGYARKDIDAGAFLSVRGGPFRFGLGSADLSGLVIGGSKASADASMQMSLAF